MRKLAVLIALLTWLALSVPAQNVAGTWVGYVEMDDFLGAIRLDISAGEKHSGSKMTLFFAGDKRSGPMEQIKADGNTISFDGKLQPSARLKGSVNGARITGVMEMIGRNDSVAASGKWEARRVDPSTLRSEDAAGPTEAAVAEVLRPTGKYPVGRRYFYWTDESRDEKITDDPADKRRLFVQLWYPAAKVSGSADVYLPDAATLITDKDRLADIGAIRTHTWRDAPFVTSPAKFPLVVFSPGLGTSPFYYTSIIEELVSHGYCVASINHPYDTGPAKFPDGTVIDYVPGKWDRDVPKDWTADERKKFFDDRRLEWGKDASFVLDQIEKESQFSAHIDFHKIGMLGHSFGGQAASIACAIDKRFKACANLDGLAQGNVMLPDAAGKMMRQPYMFFTKAAEVKDFELAMMGMSRDEYRHRERARLTERWHPSFKKQINQNSTNGYLVLYPGIEHATFSDSPLFRKTDTAPYSVRAERAKRINQFILAFFGKYLLGKAEPILDKPSASSPVMVELLKK